MSNISKERLRKLLEDAKYLCESTCLHSDPMEYIKAIQQLRKMVEDSLAAIDDIADAKGVDLDKLQKKFDKFFAEETEESFNEWLRMKGYLKSPFYCQNDIEDNGICNNQCDHCKAYYKPLDDQSTAAINKVVPISELSPEQKEQIKKDDFYDMNRPMDI